VWWIASCIGRTHSRFRETAQPDLAIVVIDYVPNRSLVESKSLKLFLNSFRNHRAFHEDCTGMIGLYRLDPISRNKQ
jgi:NADPH-dependent 7-cyano-7-deazaguanine reductase QueF